MIVLLEGEMQGRSEQSASDGRIFMIRSGDVSGLLPYSRLTRFPLTIRAMAPRAWPRSTPATSPN